MNKGNHIRWLGVVGWIMLGILIGSGSVILWYCFSHTTISNNSTYDSWQIAYYFFGIIGAIGTVLAVIVALAKESIMRWLYSPNLNVELVDNGITEIINLESSDVPISSSFECYVSVENNGRLAAIGCKAFINDIKHGKTTSNIKTIKNARKKQIHWLAAEVDMPVGIPNKLKLFEIVNPNSVGTPQPGNNNIAPKILFNGCDLTDNYVKKGYWEVAYFITCKNGEVSKFNLSVEWNGEYKSRATEMTEVLKIQLK